MNVSAWLQRWKPSPLPRFSRLQAVAAVLAVIGLTYVLRLLASRHAAGWSPTLLLLLMVLACTRLAGIWAGVAAIAVAIPLELAILARPAMTLDRWNELLLFGVTSGLAVHLIARADILRRKAVSAQQHESMVVRELDLLIDHAANYAICMLDAEGRIMIWNLGAERLFGWSEAEALGQPYHMLATASDRRAGLADHRLAIARTEGRCNELAWHVRKDGSQFLGELVLSQIEGADGANQSFGMVVRDVTIEVVQTEEIQAREALLRSVLATVPDAMVVIDEDGLIQSFSAAAEQLFGYLEEEVVGRNVAMLMPSPDSERHDEYLARYHATGKPQLIGKTRRVNGQRKDGSVFPHELVIGEATSSGHRVFTAFIRDLTQREAAEARMRELQAELLHVSRVTAVGTLASNLAHELNQPLTAISNYLQTAAALLAEQGEPRHRIVGEAMDEAAREALRAGAIVQRLRKFIARGEIERTIEAIEPLLFDAVELGLADRSHTGIQTEISVAQGTGKIFADRVQVQQVLVNLLRNAREAVPCDRGRIAICARRTADMVQFTVTDNGSGIDPAMAGHLFEAFASTKSEGMGLGLSICRTIVEAHGGRIWPESVPGGGTAFAFTIPSADEEAIHA